jgi:hypothetical protein
MPRVAGGGAWPARASPRPERARHAEALSVKSDITQKTKEQNDSINARQVAGGPGSTPGAAPRAMISARLNSGIGHFRQGRFNAITLDF